MEWMTEQGMNESMKAGTMKRKSHINNRLGCPDASLEGKKLKIAIAGMRKETFPGESEAHLSSKLNLNINRFWFCKGLSEVPSIFKAEPQYRRRFCTSVHKYETLHKIPNGLVHTDMEKLA